MLCLLARAAEQYGDNPALVDSLSSLSFRDFDREVDHLSRRLCSVGVGASSCIAYLLSNSVEQVILLMALIQLRAVACPISSRLPQSGVDACLRKVDADMLITEGAALSGNVCPTLTLADLARSGETDPLPADQTLDQPAVIFFTSGSTGEPKAVLLTLGNLYYSALGSNENILFGPGDRWLLTLPLYHVGGLGILFRALVGGGSMVIENANDDMTESIRRHEITHLSLVSTQLQRLLVSKERRKVALPSLKSILLGGSGIPSELVRTSVERGLPIHTSYGLTEMASQVTTTPTHSPLGMLLTSGRLLPYRELRISDSGEIEVRGETRFAGYVDGRQLITPFDADGWFATGDLGSLDADGCLTVKGRRDSMFISGGENIYPEEIERALCLIDGITDAIVVPAPHPEYGFRPCAFVQSERDID
ncbi:o-succinylbenzoate--CoA ligase, partial [candidate division GN15 bacterium]